jgi:8-oxo-dGTP pyrophosphatase MutT (NUDIX family)
LPGGARRLRESALEGALREAEEEAGVPADVLEVLFESVVDLGFWSYTTVVVRAREVFEPVMGDAESIALAWVPLDEVESYDLHPGFKVSWPHLRVRLLEL